MHGTDPKPRNLLQKTPFPTRQCPSAVVYDRLQLHTMAAPRIVDASIMPAMPPANTDAATLMMAQRVALYSEIR